MDKQDLQQLQEAIERAIQALEELEKALDEGDNRKVGARLYELRHALREAQRACRPQRRREAQP